VNRPAPPGGFQVGQQVTITDFQPGIYTVGMMCWPEHEAHPGMVHIWKREHDQTYEAQVHPGRVHPVDA
jgi:hypothetical protein